MFKSFHQVNQIINQILQNNEPASILRIDNTAGYVMECLHHNRLPSPEFFNLNTIIETGIYPTDMDYAFNVYNKTLNVMHNSDVLGFVDISGQLLSSDFTKQFNPSKALFAGGESFYVMDPGAILGHSHLGKLENPWTKNLKNKKVLVISTHEQTIKKQWQNIDKIWGQNRDIIAPFDLVNVIRSPYSPVIDNRQYENCRTWEDSVQYIINEIDKYEYDVLLAGCTTSAPFYVNHAKTRGKIGIQTGGCLQLFFGILGYRWTEILIHKNWHNMYNEYWMYPLKQDEPQKRNEILFLETARAYWK